jgi:hypothetical protein
MLDQSRIATDHKKMLLTYCPFRPTQIEEETPVGRRSICWQRHMERKDSRFVGVRIIEGLRTIY